MHLTQSTMMPLPSVHNGLIIGNHAGFTAARIDVLVVCALLCVYVSR